MFIAEEVLARELIERTARSMNSSRLKVSGLNWENSSLFRPAARRRYHRSV
jgi:hypothetical protein